MTLCSFKNDYYNPKNLNKTLQIMVVNVILQTVRATITIFKIYEGELAIQGDLVIQKKIGCFINF